MLRFSNVRWVALLAPLFLVAIFSDRAFAQKPADAAKTSEAQVRAALADALKRLDDGDARGFLEYYFPTEQLRQLRQANAVEQTADRLMQQPQVIDGIRSRLRRAAKAKPTFDRSGSVAEFILPPEEEEKPKEKGSPFKEPAVTIVKLTGFGNDLETVLRKGEETLDKQDVDGFVKNLFPAGELRHPEAESRHAALTQRLKDNPKLLEQMLADFQAMRTLKPQISESNHTKRLQQYFVSVRVVSRIVLSGRHWATSSRLATEDRNSKCPSHTSTSRQPASSPLRRTCRGR